jgi:hypothetical protein
VTQSSARGEKVSHVRLSLGDVRAGGPFVAAHDVVDNICVDVIVALLVVNLDCKVFLGDLEDVGGQTAAFGNAVVLVVELLSVLPLSLDTTSALELAEVVAIPRDVVDSHL